MKIAWRIVEAVIQPADLVNLFFNGYSVVCIGKPKCDINGRVIDNKRTQSMDGSELLQ